MTSQHTFAVLVEWTGNQGKGTSDYRAYARDHEIRAQGKPAIAGSSAAAFRGDAAKYNPEDLLIASLSACHMLWYLHLCAQAGIIVVAYADDAAGTLTLDKDGGGRFVEAVLRPHVTIAAGDAAAAASLHERAHSLCFIARSVNFDIRCEPTITTKER